tara:strand:- start:4664 stop:5671 length:1008 start_codon:yes stop_codon:yes gene_type:complete
MSALFERQQVLKFQEVGDLIFIAESLKVPFGRLIKRAKKPVQTLAEWPGQVYSAHGFGGTMDGTDHTSYEHTTREKLEAYVMIQRTKGWQATKLANLTRTAGVKKSEMAKQMADDGIHLSQQMERQFLSDMDTQVEAPPGTPYQSRGGFSWLSDTAQTTKPVPAALRPAAANHYTGTLANFTPAALEAMLESMSMEKKSPVDLENVCGIKLKSKMSSWMAHDADVAGETVTRQYNLDASEKKFEQIVDFFKFDSGSLRNLVSYFILCDEADGANSLKTPRSGLLFDRDMWELAYMQNPHHFEQEDKGAGPRGFHDAVYMLKCLNPLGQGTIQISS